MESVKELAHKIQRLSTEEKRRLIRLVPELLRLDEEFLLHRWRSARKDLQCGQVVTTEKALAKAKAKRRTTK